MIEFETNEEKHRRLAEYSRILQCQNAYRREAFLNYPAARFMEKMLNGRASVTESMYGCPSAQLIVALKEDLEY
jgi:hypothetical protein